MAVLPIVAVSRLSWCRLLGSRAIDPLGATSHVLLVHYRSSFPPIIAYKSTGLEEHMREDIEFDIGSRRYKNRKKCNE